jgi:hypothetical protein
MLKLPYVEAILQMFAYVLSFESSVSEYLELEPPKTTRTGSGCAASAA